MVDFIEELYQYAQLGTFFREIIEKCRQYDDALLMVMWDDMLENIVEFCKKVYGMDAVLGKTLWEQLQTACEYSTRRDPDYLSMGDGLERALPNYYKAMRLFGEIDVTENGYRLFSSDSGFLSLQNVNTGRLIHGSLDPMEEARCIARKIYTVKQQNCRIMGCGLGYLPYQLYKMSNERFDVYVYETDAQLIEYAKEYGVLSWIPEDRLHIVVDEREDSLIEKFIEDADRGMAGRTAYYCSDDIYSRMTSYLKDQIATLNSTITSYYSLRELSEGNFYRNLENVKHTIYEMEITGDTSEWIIIGGGPSLDDQIDYIRENTGKKQIIVASTVYRKLLKLGIKPDFVVVVDPQNRTFGHMVDVDDFSAKLLLNAVGNWKFSEYYKGKKYLIPCAGHECVTEYYKGTDVKMVDTGSSVTVTCAQIATLLGAKRIDLIGLDMSFPGNVSHASGTMDCTVSEREGYPEIECVAGGMVKTKYEYIFYLREVENVISANKNVEFVNYSNGGAAIKGSKWYKNLSN